MRLPIPERPGRSALVLAFAAWAAAASPIARAQVDIPRMGPGHCQGQPVIAPLEPLSILTAHGPAQFKVELAETEAQHAYGLMCRTRLAPNRGMLFDFHRPTNDVAFWMRNTLIGLDIVFIGPDGRVVSIARKAAPLDERPIPAGGTIRGVLEIPAGRAAELGVQPGDRVVHRIFGS